jgi:diguanylate cyclase (GGDEF)-like protein/PAS domain S-box-containing protein/putative nucleotidyltransferase with HDIG domain
MGESNKFFEDKNIYKLYFESANILAMVLDVNGNVKMINNKGSEVLGLPKENIIGLNWFEHFIPEDIKEEIKMVFKKIVELDHDFPNSYINSLVNVRGEKFTIRWTNDVIKDKNDKVIGVMTSGEDFTTLINYQTSLEKNEYILLQAQKLGKIGSWELDLSTRTIFASNEAFRIYGLEDIDGSVSLDKVQKMVDEEDREFLDKSLENLWVNDEPYDVVFKLHSADGLTKYIHSKAEIYKKSIGKVKKIIGIIQDITLLKQKENELKYLANYDYLTGLPNRRFFSSFLDEVDHNDNYPLTVVMADVNGLKLINDAFGHDSGDLLLKAAANIMKSACTEKDFIARIGGDEFVIVLPKVPVEEVENRIQNIKEKALKTKVESIPLSIAFGYQTKLCESDDINAIIRRAEDMMYRQKLLEIPSMRSGAIEIILATLYEKDSFSEAHSQRVSKISVELAKAYGLSSQEITDVKNTGLLHDIGKIIIPSNILNKHGKLTNEEYEIIKTHSEIGYRILNSISATRKLSEYVLNHHERWDGKGYPFGKKGDEIPLIAQIVSIADAFDAMTSERSYREIISKEEALAEIIKNSGTQFFPELVRVFSKDFKKILKNNT